MKPEILDPPSPPSSPEVRPMEPIPSSAASSRHWRLSLPVSLGVVVLVASFVIAALSLQSHAKHGDAPSLPAATPADEQPWYSLGTVDIKGSVTPLYPVQPGRVKNIEAKENVPVKAGAPLLYLDDSMQQLKVQEAKAGVEEAQGRWKEAQSGIAALEKQIAAQREAVEAAKLDVQRALNVYNEKKRLKDLSIGAEVEVRDLELQWERAKKAVRGEQRKLDALEALKGKAEGTITAAHANLQYKQTLLAEAEKAVKECVVRAPEDGTPLRINVSVGQILDTNPRQPAVEFAADRALLVRAEVEQEFATRVRRDQNVVITDHVTGQECGRGKVVSIARWYARRRTLTPEMLAMSNDVRTLECIVELTSSSPEVRIGQRVRIQFPK
jgi:multidrug resistance efflux pump